MNRFGVLAVVGVVAVSQVACGSDSSDDGSSGGGGPDFTAMEGKLTQPTGTFAPGQEGAVQNGFGEQSTAAQGNPFGGGSSSGTSGTKSLGIQTLHTLDASTSCDSLKSGGKGSCACPNGGTLTFDIPANVTGSPGQDPNGTIDQTVSILASACGMSAEQTIDGSIYWKIKSPPPMQLFSVHIAITGKAPAKYDVEYLNQNGVVTFAIEVADGRVLVSAKGSWDKDTKTGTLVIKDKNETWTCQMTNGKGTCTSDKGATRPVG